MSKNITAEQRHNLLNLISKWKLSQTMIADMVQMGRSTFRNKLNATNGLYAFTYAEYLQVCSAIDKLFADLQTFLEERDSEMDRNW